MKKLLLLVAALAAALPSLCAQTLSISAPGFSATRLFDSSAGFAISGMGADATGAIYYLETDGALSTSTRLYRRTPGDAYGSATQLFNFGTAVFGSFVTVESGRVYFGESSTNTIRSVAIDGTNPLLHGTVVGNYDMAFASGSAFVSANPDTTFVSPENRVSRMDLSSGATDLILDATPDYSGPLEIDNAGNLFYGVASGAIGGVYRFTAAEVAGAFGPTNLTLAPPTQRVIANGGNQWLAYDGSSQLWQNDFSTLRRYDLGSGLGTTIGSSSQTLGHLDFKNATLYANITNFGTYRSAVYAVTPEPSAALLLVFGVITLGARRK